MLIFYKKLGLIFFLFLTVINAQNIYLPDSIFYNSEKVLSGKINSVLENTVVIESNGKNVGIAVFMIDSICFSGNWKIFSRPDGYLYDVDSLNLYLSVRDHNPDQIWQEKPSKQVTVDKDSSTNQVSNRYEFSIAGGALTTAQFSDALEELTSVVPLGDIEVKEESGNQIHFGFSYIRESKWAFGIHVSYEKYNNLYYRKSEKIGNVKTTYVTIALNTSYYWLKTESLQYYSGFGIGFSHEGKVANGSVNVDLQDETYPGLQLNLIGLKVGYRLFFLMEIGIGYRGLLNIGLAYQI